jgi:hypothetical protein
MTMLHFVTDIEGKTRAQQQTIKSAYLVLSDCLFVMKGIKDGIVTDNGTNEQTEYDELKSIADSNLEILDSFDCMGTMVFKKFIVDNLICKIQPDMQARIRNEDKCSK